MKIPGYSDAVQWERDRREESFLGFVAPIRGVPVQPLSLRRLLFLLQGDCAILHGRMPDAASVLQFLWIVSPKFRAGDLDARALFDADAIRVGALSNLAAVDREIREYLDAALNDAPASQVGSAPDEAPVTCFAASLVHVVASEYGWTLDQILDTPLACLYGLMRKIALKYDGKAVFISRRSRKVKGDWLRSLRGHFEGGGITGGPRNHPPAPPANSIS